MGASLMPMPTITQDGRFASIQTGNLLYLVIHLVEGHIARAFSYVIPIFFFVLGQFLFFC